MRREDRAVVAQLGFLHGMVHANLLAIPVFLNLPWRSEFLADDVTIGLLAAIVYAFFGLSSVPFGYLADRRSPSKLLFASACGIAASLASIALSPSLPVLAVSLAALGLFSGIYHPTALAAISRAVEEQGRGMGWHGMGGSLGIALGPAFVGGALTIGWSWRTVLGPLVVLPVLGAILLATRPLPESTMIARSYVHPSPRSLLTIPYARTLLVYLFAGFAYQGALTFLPRFIGAGPFALALGLGAVGQVLAGTLADRSRPDRILFTLSLGAAGLLVLLAVLGPSTEFLLAALGFGFLLFSLEPLQNTLVTRTVPLSMRGFGFGLTFLSVFGLGSIGAAIAGWLMNRGESSLMFLLLGASLAVSGGVALGVRSLRTT
ncbi:MAG: MFS transporter [Thermoplasmata archaeon]